MINTYQKRLWKYILLAFAVVIAAGSLLYTNYLVKNISKSERTRAQLWAQSTRRMVTVDDNDDLSFVISVRDSSVVPAIVTDAKGDIINAKGLDTTKTWIEGLPVTKNGP